MEQAKRFESAGCGKDVCRGIDSSTFEFSLSPIAVDSTWNPSYRSYEATLIEPKLSNSCGNSKTSRSNQEEEEEEEEPKSQLVLSHPLAPKLDLLPVLPPPRPLLPTMIDLLTLLRDQGRI